MNASEIILRLDMLIKEHGDLEVKIWNDLTFEFDAVNEIEPRRITPDQRAAMEERKKIFLGVDTYAVGDWSAQLRYDGKEE